MDPSTPRGQLARGQRRDLATRLGHKLCVVDFGGIVKPPPDGLGRLAGNAQRDEEVAVIVLGVVQDIGEFECAIRKLFRKRIDGDVLVSRAAMDSMMHLDENIPNLINTLGHHVGHMGRLADPRREDRQRRNGQAWESPRRASRDERVAMVRAHPRLRSRLHHLSRSRC